MFNRNYIFNPGSFSSYVSLPECISLALYSEVIFEESSSPNGSRIEAQTIAVVTKNLQNPRGLVMVNPDTPNLGPRDPQDASLVTNKDYVTFLRWDLYKLTFKNATGILGGGRSKKKNSP